MNLKQKHLFHIVERSPWPFFTALGAFLFTSGLGFYMHRINLGLFLFFLGFLVLLFCAFFWFNEIIEEATYQGMHTLVVRKGLKLGFWLFIASEIMLFFGFFWAFFHSALSPSEEFGLIWPPVGINVIPTAGYPLFNTFLLIISGISVTWVHKGVCLGSFKEAIDGFFITIILGISFILLQMIEYYESTFNINDSVYSSTFYLLTGLHGCHVIIGVIFLIICFFRLLLNHYLINHYTGLVFAIWYWHFVDLVWILLFFTVYFW
jgi:heme/copper-type cytochrome/quinol oxidase subunit 3